MNMRTKILMSLIVLMGLPVFLVLLSIGNDLSFLSQIPNLVSVAFYAAMFLGLFYRISKAKQELPKYEFVIPMSLWSSHVLLAGFLGQRIYPQALLLFIIVTVLIPTIVGVLFFKKKQSQA